MERAGFAESYPLEGSINSKEIYNTRASAFYIAACFSFFWEIAVEFYCGYLTAENDKKYFSDVIVSTTQGTLDCLENRMAKTMILRL